MHTIGEHAVLTVVMVWLAMSWVGVTSGAQVSGTPTSLEQRLEAYRAGRFRPATDSWDWPFDPGSERTVRDIGRSDRADPVAAAFLLEYAEAAYRAGRSVAFDTFERALVIARREPSGSAFDRAWHTAALALTEARGAGIDLGTVQSADHNPRDGHVYPGERRSVESILEALAPRLEKFQVALGKGILHEQVTRYRTVLMIRSLEKSPRVRSGPPGSRVDALSVREANISYARRLLHEVAGAFESAARYPEVRPEALLRRAATLAFMAEYRAVLREGEHPEAAAMFEEAARLTEDTRLRYLVSFFSGRYFQSRGDVAKAERHYSNAAAIIPRAWSSRMALANLRYQSGHPPSDEELVSLVDPQPRNDDPWISYPYGSYARWPELIAQLRATLASGER